MFKRGNKLFESPQDTKCLNSAKKFVAERYYLKIKARGQTDK